MRFIIESSLSGISSFTDYETELSPGQDPNDDEWTFSLSTPATLTPWPTRILGNVITKDSPLCYPAYYLTDDAYVTIKAYDIKGRSVATLLDSAYRRGGMNIKEGGWGAINRSGKKLGVGLYYIHFKASRSSDGKTILNKFSKVVVAR